MKITIVPRAALLAALVGLLLLSPTWAATISAVSVAKNVTNFSPSGLDIGSAGYWFANFAAPSPSKLAPVDQNDANNLPSWLTVNFDPGSSKYSFPLDNGDNKPYAVSNGGLAGYNTLTLPNGESGLSGQLVDTRMTPNQSDTLVKDLTFGASSPTSILFHVILDNAALSEATALSRVRATYRMPADGNTIVRALFDIPLDGNDGIADVYTFRLDGIQPTGYLALQLVTSGASTGAGMAGFAFDPVPIPEPSTLAMAGMALLCVAGGATRQRRAQHGK